MIKLYLNSTSLKDENGGGELPTSIAVQKIHR